LQADTNLWNRCVRDLQAELPEQQFNTWIRPLQAVEEGRVLRLLAPNRFVVDWLQQHYIERILELIDGAGGASEVVVEVGSRRSEAVVHGATRSARTGAAAPVASRLNPAFTFEHFGSPMARCSPMSSCAPSGSRPR
jgi:chromosomal replication initiator protein